MKQILSTKAYFSSTKNHAPWEVLALVALPFAVIPSTPMRP